MSHVIVGTAGHVDHGKTALIKALTGSETDRLREEKERGISIELGFAPFKLPSGRLAGVVDVPGHERFIHNMLAGIGGIDLVLLVVDVTEGVMPQTREHVEIMELLQIANGVVVLAKVDLAEDEEWLDLVEEEVREALAGTFLADAPCFRVSAHTGAGITELVAAIDQLTAELPARDELSPLRLPVDRVFTITGFGTIVTGTLLSGRVSQGMNVQVLPDGRTARVRQVQVHGQTSQQAVAGQRAAVNLSGVEKGALPRGSVIAAPDSLNTTYMLDARLKLLDSAPRTVKNLTRVHIYLGTGRSVGRIVLLDKEELEPGEDALIQLRLEKKLVSKDGDRFIIRSFSPMSTIGGGIVLDASPQKHKRLKSDVLSKLNELEKGDPTVPLLRRIRTEPGITYQVLEKQAGLAPQTLQDYLQALEAADKVINIGEMWVDAISVNEWRDKLLQSLSLFHQENHLAVGMSKALLRGILPKEVPPKIYDWLISELSGDEQIRISDDVVALAAHQPEPTEKERAIMDKILALYHELGFMPPSMNEVAEKVKINKEQAEKYLAYLIWQERLVRLDEQFALHIDFFMQAKEHLRQHFLENKTLAAGEFREKLGSTRKYVVPLLETFDRLKWTRRNKDERVLWRFDLDKGEGTGNGR